MSDVIKKTVTVRELIREFLQKFKTEFIDKNVEIQLINKKIQLSNLYYNFLNDNKTRINDLCKKLDELEIQELNEESTILTIFNKYHGSISIPEELYKLFDNTETRQHIKDIIGNNYDENNNINNVKRLLLEYSNTLLDNCKDKNDNLESNYVKTSLNYDKAISNSTIESNSKADDVRQAEVTSKSEIPISNIPETVLDETSAINKKIDDYLTNIIENNRSDFFINTTPIFTDIFQNSTNTEESSKEEVERNKLLFSILYLGILCLLPLVIPDPKNFNAQDLKKEIKINPDIISTLFTNTPENINSEYTTDYYNKLKHALVYYINYIAFKNKFIDCDSEFNCDYNKIKQLCTTVYINHFTECISLLKKQETYKILEDLDNIVNNRESSNRNKPEIQKPDDITVDKNPLSADDFGPKEESIKLTDTVPEGSNKDIQNVAKIFMEGVFAEFMQNTRREISPKTNTEPDSNIISLSSFVTPFEKKSDSSTSSEFVTANSSPPIINDGPPIINDDILSQTIFRSVTSALLENPNQNQNQNQNIDMELVNKVSDKLAKLKQEQDNQDLMDAIKKEIVKKISPSTLPSNLNTNTTDNIQKANSSLLTATKTSIEKFLTKATDKNQIQEPNLVGENTEALTPAVNYNPDIKNAIIKAITDKINSRGNDNIVDYNDINIDFNNEGLLSNKENDIRPASPNEQLSNKNPIRYSLNNNLNPSNIFPGETPIKHGDFNTPKKKTDNTSIKQITADNPDVNTSQLSNTQPDNVDLTMNPMLNPNENLKNAIRESIKKEILKNQHPELEEHKDQDGTPSQVDILSKAITDALRALNPTPVTVQPTSISTDTNPQDDFDAFKLSIFKNINPNVSLSTTKHVESEKQKTGIEAILEQEIEAKLKQPQDPNQQTTNQQTTNQDPNQQNKPQTQSQETTTIQPQTQQTQYLQNQEQPPITNQTQDQIQQQTQELQKQLEAQQIQIELLKQQSLKPPEQVKNRMFFNSSVKTAQSYKYVNKNQQDEPNIVNFQVTERKNGKEISCTSENVAVGLDTIEKLECASENMMELYQTFLTNVKDKADKTGTQAVMNIANELKGVSIHWNIIGRNSPGDATAANNEKLFYDFIDALKEKRVDFLEKPSIDGHVQEFLEKTKTPPDTQSGGGIGNYRSSGGAGPDIKTAITDAITAKLSGATPPITDAKVDIKTAITDAITAKLSGATPPIAGEKVDIKTAIQDAITAKLSGTNPPITDAKVDIKTAIQDAITAKLSGTTPPITDAKVDIKTAIQDAITAKLSGTTPPIAGEKVDITNIIYPSIGTQTTIDSLNPTSTINTNPTSTINTTVESSIKNISKDQQVFIVKDPNTKEYKSETKNDLEDLRIFVTIYRTYQDDKDVLDATLLKMLLSIITFIFCNIEIEVVTTSIPVVSTAPAPVVTAVPTKTTSPTNVQAQTTSPTTVPAKTTSATAVPAQVQKPTTTQVIEPTTVPVLKPIDVSKYIYANKQMFRTQFDNITNKILMKLKKMKPPKQ